MAGERENGLTWIDLDYGDLVRHEEQSHARRLMRGRWRYWIFFALEAVTTLTVYWAAEWLWGK